MGAGEGVWDYWQDRCSQTDHAPELWSFLKTLASSVSPGGAVNVGADVKKVSSQHLPASQTLLG